MKQTLVLLMLTAAAVVASELHSNRRNGGRRRNDNRPGTTTTTESSSIGDDEEDVVAAAAAQQDQPDNNGSVETCEVARLKCAYRVGCGMALQNYMVGCSDVITGSSQRCSDHCRNSLIALTSTEEGEALMKCKCGDTFCRDSKKRIDICRSAVLRATHNSTTVSCSVAQWICIADPLCSTALDYYNRFCRSMFAGKKCTLRCKNSISILKRQEKAAKLSTCVCDGSEDYDCPSVLDNMDRLCYHKVTVRPSLPSMSTTKSTTTSSTSARDQSAGEGLGPGVEDVIQSGDHPGHHQSKTRPHHHHRHPHPPVTPDDAESIGIITNEVDTTRLPPPSSRAAATCWPALSALQLLLLSAVLIQQHHAGRASFLQIMTG